MFPTPTAGDARSSGSRNTEDSKAHAGISLTDAIRGDGGKGRLQTPRDGMSGFLGQLNPQFEEWIMGYPLNWSNISANIICSMRVE